MNQAAYFKRHQRNGLYHYYHVSGGSGKDKKGYQEVINFLNPIPIIYIERNYENDPSGLTGTWCTYEVGEPISREEYAAAYKKATAVKFKIK
jgi:hypothetical protein